MGSVYFILAILGCGDGSVDCKAITTLPQQFESEAACTAASEDALIANSSADFPSLYADCRPVKRKASLPSPQRATGISHS